MGLVLSMSIPDFGCGLVRHTASVHFPRPQCPALSVLTSLLLVSLAGGWLLSYVAYGA